MNVWKLTSPEDLKRNKHSISFIDEKSFYHSLMTEEGYTKYIKDPDTTLTSRSKVKWFYYILGVILASSLTFLLRDQPIWVPLILNICIISIFVFLGTYFSVKKKLSSVEDLEVYLDLISVWDNKLKDFSSTLVTSNDSSYQEDVSASGIILELFGLGLHSEELSVKGGISAELNKKFIEDLTQPKNNIPTSEEWIYEETNHGTANFSNRYFVGFIDQKGNVTVAGRHTPNNLVHLYLTSNWTKEDLFSDLNSALKKD